MPRHVAPRGRPPIHIDPAAGPLAAFAHLLRDRRLSLGLSMSEVARRAGCSASILGEYERGERAPRDEQFVRDLARVIDVPADELIVAWNRTRRVRLPPRNRRSTDPGRQVARGVGAERRVAVTVGVVVLSMTVGAAIVLVVESIQ